MDKNKRYLDDLFAKARSERAELTEQEVRALIEAKDSMQSVQPSLLKTRKGMWIMTSIATLVTAALVAYFGLATKPAVEKQSATSWAAKATEATTPPRPATMKIDTSARKPQRTYEVRIMRKDVDSSEIPPMLDGIDRGHALLAPQEIGAIRPVNLPESDFGKLGLKNTKGLGLSFYIKNGKHSFDKFYIPEQGWGVVIPPNQTEEAPVVAIEPLIVTDVHGNKRLINYRDDRSSLRMQQSSEQSDDTTGSGHLRHNARNLMSLTIHDSSSSPEDVLKSMRIEHSTDTELTDLSNQVQDAVRKATEEIETMRKDTNLNAQLQIIKDVAIEINDSVQSKNDRNELDEQEVLRRAGLPNLIADSSGHGRRMVRINVSKKLSRRADSLLHDLPALSKEFSIDFGGRFQQIEEKISRKLDRLVPVLVRASTKVTHNSLEDRDYDNGVIMWFEPTKEFADAVPDLAPAVASASQIQDKNNGNNNGGASVTIAPIENAAVLHDAFVYPNPASTLTTVRFSLNAPRTVAFSVHNILGQRMIDDGQVTYSQAGEQQYQLHLEGLTEGVYLLALTTERGEQIVQRIVVKK